MFPTREDLERKTKYFSQQAWAKRETVTTVNHIIESMLTEFGDWAFREIERELAQKEYSDGEVRGVSKPQRNSKSKDGLSSDQDA